MTEKSRHDSFKLKAKLFTIGFASSNYTNLN